MKRCDESFSPRSCGIRWEHLHAKKSQPGRRILEVQALLVAPYGVASPGEVNSPHDVAAKPSWTREIEGIWFTKTLFKCVGVHCVKRNSFHTTNGIKERSAYLHETLRHAWLGEYAAEFLKTLCFNRIWFEDDATGDWRNILLCPTRYFFRPACSTKHRLFYNCTCSTNDIL